MPPTVGDIIIRDNLSYTSEYFLQRRFLVQPLPFNRRGRRVAFEFEHVVLQSGTLLRDKSFLDRTKFFFESKAVLFDRIPALYNLRPRLPNCQPASLASLPN
jgi:hypothetical protein